MFVGNHWESAPHVYMCIIDLVWSGLVLTPSPRELFSQTVKILVFDLSAQSGIGRVLGALALRANDLDGGFGSGKV